MTTISMPKSPPRAFSFIMNPPKKDVDARPAQLAEPSPKRKRWNIDCTPTSFDALAARAPFRSPRSTRPSPVSSLAKYPVEIETASRLNQFVFAGTFREEIETTLHGDTDERNTQRNRGGEQYDAQISGIKGRLYVSETIVGSLKNRFRAVEKVVFVQEKEISTLASETKVQGDIIKQQSDELEELRLMIQGLQELCIKNDGNKAADVVAPEKEKRDDGKKKKAGRIGKNVLIEDQNGETPVVVLPEIKVLNRLLKKELQNLCGKHRIAFCADKDTRPVLISKLTATLKTE